MRNVMLAFAFMIFVSRLFTGIVYEYGDPTTYFVLKHTPAFAIEQENGADHRIRDRFTVIDGGENELSYQAEYVFVMRWAPAIIAASLALAYVFHRRRMAR